MWWECTHIYPSKLSEGLVYVGESVFMIPRIFEQVISYFYPGEKIQFVT